MGAAVISSFSAFSFRWGADVRREVLAREDRGELDLSEFRLSSESLELFCVVVAYAFSRVLSAPVNIVIGIAGGETVDTRLLAFGLLSGLFANGLGVVLFRKANLATSNLGVNALAYAIPVLSLLWL